MFIKQQTFEGKKTGNVYFILFAAFRFDINAKSSQGLAFIICNVKASNLCFPFNMPPLQGRVVISHAFTINVLPFQGRESY